jgi:hypothetical protein
MTRGNSGDTRSNHDDDSENHADGTDDTAAFDFHTMGEELCNDSGDKENYTDYDCEHI